MEPVIARLRESARTLGLCFLVLLAGPGRLAAQDSASRLFPASADNGGPAPSETASLTRAFPVYRLLPEESRDHERWMASADFGTDVPLRLGLGPQRPTETPLTSVRHPLVTGRRTRWTPLHGPTRPKPRYRGGHSWSVTGCSLRHSFRSRRLAAVTANSLIGYDTDHGFQVSHEAWFGPNTTNGGADKASHLTDYFIVASLFEDGYRVLGYSENAAILWGFGLAVATGLANEVSDGFTRHGFSWEDLAMDAAGATVASVISLTHTRDLFGMRTSHLPGSTYTHDVLLGRFQALRARPAAGRQHRAAALAASLGHLRLQGLPGLTPDRTPAPGRLRDRPQPSADPERPRSEEEHVVGLHASSHRTTSGSRSPRSGCATT